MSAWLKAGLIGGGVMFVLTLLGQIPFINCCTWVLVLLAYVGVGVLAAYYMLPPRESGQAAGQGALASALAALIGGVVSFIIGLVRAAIWGASQSAEMWSQLPPDVRYMFQDLGITPDMIGGIGGAVVCNSVCCVGGVLFAAILGAIGAAIYAASKPQ